VSRSARSSRANSSKSRARLTVVRSEPSTPVEHFVEAMATDLGLSNGSSDRRTRRQLLRLTQWATAEGMALDREVILGGVVSTISIQRRAMTPFSGSRRRALGRAL
jgi:hypothetical protein